MKIANVVKNRFFSKDPFFLVLYVTSRCNARCKMCYYWDEITEWRSRPHLEVDEIEKITSHISSLQQLTISGGEPFLREELAEICTMFRKNSKVQFITIPTNGILTQKTEKVMKKALEENPDVHFRIGLSTPEIYEELEELYGVKDAFEKHQTTFKMLKDLRRHYSNLNIDVGVVHNKYNAERVKEVIDFATEHMEDCNPIVSVVRGKPQLEDSHEISVQYLDQVYTYLRNQVKKLNNRPFGDMMNLMRDIVHEITIKTLQTNQMQVPCTAGKKLLVIYDNGDVYPCELLEKKMGNIRDHSYNIHEVMGLETSKKTVDWIKKEKCFCTWECANNNNILFDMPWTFGLFARYALYKVGLYPFKTKHANTEFPMPENSELLPPDSSPTDKESSNANRKRTVSV